VGAQVIGFAVSIPRGWKESRLGYDEFLKGERGIS
jgi:hypothetical protein